jgi:very-short-patch-repair endonuclease
VAWCSFHPNRRIELCSSYCVLAVGSPAVTVDGYQTRYHHQTQVEIPVTTADFYFSLETRPLLVFVEGRVHLGTAQMAKDEELRSLLRKRGYRVLELYYDDYSDKKRDKLYEEILANLAQLAYQS